MPEFPSKSAVWNVPQGQLIVRSFCGSEEIAALRFPDSFKKFASYQPIISSLKRLVGAAAKPGANVVIVHEPGNDIVGVGVMEPPPSGERWHRVGDDVMLEVSVIEVSREWRSGGVARKLLSLLMDHPNIEDRIVYMVGYSWTWDLDGVGKTAMEYRNILMNLFARFQFKPYPTNEPNVCLRPENLFMARIGARVSPEVQRKFKWVRFNLDLHT
ncbi:MAG: N-acetyltransferase [Deltaproteobacteria bacterium]|nr:N-acetyltransferase [Deltaproteobacteria bacterium]